MEYYVIDWQEQGIGRRLYCAPTEETLKSLFSTEEEWNYFKLGMEVFPSYTEARYKYTVLPNTLNPPSEVKIIWRV